MKITLKDFQSDYVAEFGKKFVTVRTLAANEPAAVLLNSPTGSGKTAMITAFIEERLDGSEDTVGDPELVFVWLTDDPELNKQTYDKMLTTSSALSSNDLVIIDAGLDVEQHRNVVC
jgi:type III restriction enzyme